MYMYMWVSHKRQAALMDRRWFLPILEQLAAVFPLSLGSFFLVFLFSRSASFFSVFLCSLPSFLFILFFFQTSDMELVHLMSDEEAWRGGISKEFSRGNLTNW
ncbi:hypothetical protein B0T19DRAFT_162506 [Cercophora scortea]|uniref:Uncharacterized protein n=1 Tax=Cercophora scortea TaxID=314031 RepID=A0AAE0ILU0_9PEZI|nr:hypothetical protein B0T19DRAFT_162506 [Cercophora scortea]